MKEVRFPVLVYNRARNVAYRELRKHKDILKKNGVQIINTRYEEAQGNIGRITAIHEVENWDDCYYDKENECYKVKECAHS